MVPVWASNKTQREIPLLQATVACCVQEEDDESCIGCNCQFTQKHGSCVSFCSPHQTFSGWSDLRTSWSWDSCHGFCYQCCSTLQRPQVPEGAGSSRKSLKLPAAGNYFSSQPLGQMPKTKPWGTWERGSEMQCYVLAASDSWHFGVSP